MLKKIFILLFIGTLPALAEPQFDFMGGMLFYIFVFVSKAFEFSMFLSPLILLVVIVIVIEKIFNNKKEK